MRAVTLTAIGDPGPLEYGQVPDPDILRPTQIKVRIGAAGVNPIDTKLRRRGLFYGAQPPAILGCDGAGEVIAVGEAVRRFTVGDEVWFCHGGLGREPGNYAELTVIDEREAEFKPARSSLVEAAAGPLTLITAWEALFDRGRLAEGQTVFVSAGAGGVGHLAIQLAKTRGAKVATTVSTPQKAQTVTALGADLVINYRTDDVAAAINDWTHGHGVDLAFDTVGTQVFRQAIGFTKHYGTLVTLLDPGTDLDLSEARVRNLSIAFTLMLTPLLRDLPQARAHHGEILRICAEWLDEKRIKVWIGDTYPLAKAAEAHRQIELGHTTGKLVLLP